MNRIQWKTILPHIIAVLVFLLVAVIYCKPVLEGKVLQQSDITQWKGMAQNSIDCVKKNGGDLPWWSNGMFGGMPAYQIIGTIENPISIGYIGSLISMGLPKPMAAFFIASLCFYFLTQVLRINTYVGMIGALAYAYATYNPIIVAAGHDNKMNAIAYLPALIASLLLIFDKKYLAGLALTAVFATMQFGTNHIQITYYGFIIIGFMSIAFAIQCIKEKDIAHLGKTVGLAVLGILLGILVNSVSLLSTYEYAKKTIRGGSVLADSSSHTTKTGLSTDYALSYSMYKTEPLVMMFPRLYGGSSNNLELAQEKSKAIEALQQMPQQLSQQIQSALQFYWGGISQGTSGPPYIGAIICFLALIGFVIVDKKYTFWMLATIIFTLLLSWGKYFEGFNIAMLKYLPMYNKFRAPSMILVVPAFLFCLLATLSLNKILFTEKKLQLWQQYKKGLMVVASVFAITIIVYGVSDFSSEGDKILMAQVNKIPDANQREQIGLPVKQFISALKEDRKNLFIGDLLRTFLFCSLAAGLVFLSIKQKLNTILSTIAIGLFAMIDLFTINSTYLNSNNYQDPIDYENTFTPSIADSQILKDTSNYRVLNLSQGISAAFNSGALSAYFHKSIGGYHPAKLSIYQDLIEKQLYNFPNCMPVLNMLNTKYLILPDPQTGQPVVQQNFMALGSCWFVKGIRFEKSPAAVMNALTNFSPKDTAILDDKYMPFITRAASDSSARIQLLANNNDLVTYQTNSSINQFAVFSEIFYEDGWIARIDGKEQPIFQTNYVLRGMEIPAGKHQIVFSFEPRSILIGKKASIGSSAIIWLLLIAAAVGSYRKNKLL